jgi:hypothetical protein
MSVQRVVVRSEDLALKQIIFNNDKELLEVAEQVAFNML